MRATVTSPWKGGHMEEKIEVTSKKPVILQNWYRVDILVNEKYFDHVFFDSYKDAKEYIRSHRQGEKE